MIKMKHRCLVLAILVSMLSMLSMLLAPLTPAQAEPGSAGEPYPGEALCLPDAYLNNPGDCLPLGPSQTLTDLAKKGLTFPPRPLPAVAPSRDLTKSPVQVAKINIESTDPANIYSSLDDAASGNNPV